jgi:hypothetical protein
MATNRAFRLRYRPRVLVQDVGGGERVNVRQRGIAIVGAEDVENFIGGGRRGEPRREPRLDRRPIRPHERFSRSRNEGGAREQGKLARRGHVDRARRDQLAIAAALGDRVDERRFRGTVVAEHVAGEIVNLRSART